VGPSHAPGNGRNYGTSEGYIYQAALRSREVKVNPFWVTWRLLRMSMYLAWFWIGVLWNRLLIIEVDERSKRNARSFREIIESLKGVWIKLGQQMSQRPDILPPAYCDELDQMLHEIKEKISRPDVEEAIRRQMGKPWNEIFADFQWESIGSASVSCVYRAVLHTGEEVAVKVRRPGINRLFTADLKALEWLMKFAEVLTIWRPGTSANFREELKNVLLEELDFRQEARYQELFRRYHKRRKKLNVTAPKIYYEYSGEEIMVSEFVRGRKVQAVIKAMYENDWQYLAELERDGIEPKRVAKQLVRSRYYSFHECPLFHGDPHPANIVVQPNNRVVMIDFGACGVFSERDRRLMWQLNQYYYQEDVGGMVNMVMSIMEPIAPVNGIDDFKRELLDAWWTGFYGIKSKHADWWERSSFRLWLKFFELIRKYEIPIPRKMVRMIRATLLYDTVASRLYPEINVFKEFQKYSEGVARRTRRHIQECAVRQLLLGPDDANYMKVQQIANVTNGLLFRLQKFLDDPEFRFTELAGKVYSAVRAFTRLFVLILSSAVVAMLIGAIYGLTLGNSIVLNPLEWKSPFLLSVFAIWLAVVGVLLMAYGRRVYLRFGDVDD
jgi:ubiquinone biosynthesis protein